MGNLAHELAAQSAREARSMERALGIVKKAFRDCASLPPGEIREGVIAALVEEIERLTPPNRGSAEKSPPRLEPPPGEVVRLGEIGEVPGDGDDDPLPPIPRDLVPLNAARLVVLGEQLDLLAGWILKMRCKPMTEGAVEAFLVQVQRLRSRG